MVAGRASCHVANAFLTRLKLIWPRSSLETAKMFFAKSSRSQWVKGDIEEIGIVDKSWAFLVSRYDLIPLRQINMGKVGS